MKLNMKSIGGMIMPAITDTAGLAGGAYVVGMITPKLQETFPKAKPAYINAGLAVGAQILKRMMGGKGIIAAAFDGMTAAAGSAAINDMATASTPPVAGVGMALEQLPNYNPDFGNINGIYNMAVADIPGQDGIGNLGNSAFAAMA